MLVLTLLWAHGAVAARSSTGLLDRLSEPGPRQELNERSIFSQRWRPDLDQALEDLRIQPTDKQKDELEELLRKAGINDKSDLSREDYLELVKESMRVVWRPKTYRELSWTHRALKDLGIKATEKQIGEVKYRIRRAGIGENSDVSFEEYVQLVKLYMPLDVTASAVAFCSDLVKGMTAGKKEFHGFFNQLWNWRAIKSRMYQQVYGRYSFGDASPQQLTGLAAEDIQMEAKKFKGLCPEILTGSLDKGPKWALEAANWSQPGGEHHKLGRLDNVHGSHWEVSFKRVCKDECEALVQRIQEQAGALYRDFTQKSQKPKTVEQSCADHIVKHVESEILGCCSRSCALRHSSIAPLKS